MHKPIDSAREFKYYRAQVSWIIAGLRVRLEESPGSTGQSAR